MTSTTLEPATNDAASTSANRSATRRSQSVGVVILTHNHSNTLERCLASLKWADEILLIDGGSNDTTLQIAKKHAVTILYHPSPERFIRLQYALNVANSDWLLHLEPTEWVPEMLGHKIDGLLLAPGSVDAYTLPILPHWQGKPLKHGGQQRKALRLFRRTMSLASTNPYHEGFTTNAPTGTLAEALYAEPYSTLDGWMGAVNQRSTQAATQLIEALGPEGGVLGRYLRSSVNLLIRPAFTFVWRYLFRLGILDGVAGLIAASMASTHVFLKYTKYRRLCG